MALGFAGRNILAEWEILQLEHKFFTILDIKILSSCLTTLRLNNNLKNDHTQHWHEMLFQKFLSVREISKILTYI